LPAGAAQVTAIARFTLAGVFASAPPMALAAPPANDRKRVKVYELKNNDWFDRGTGFCRGLVVTVGAGCMRCTVLG
jgi:hypothetical protein